MPVKSKNILQVLKYFIVAGIILLILAICGVFKPQNVTKIEIAYGTGAREYAQNINDFENDIIRKSGLYNKSMSDFDSFLKQASSNIDYVYGYIYVADIEKTGASAIRITVNYRKPLAVISSANNPVVDKDGYVVDFRDKAEASKDDLVWISGLDVKTEGKGFQVTLNSTDESLLQDALDVVKAINETGYYSVFKEITMLDNENVRLIAYNNSTKIPVRINLRYDVPQSLDIAYQILKKMSKEGNVTSGTIIVTGNNGYFDPDTTEGSSSAKGM